MDYVLFVFNKKKMRIYRVLGRDLGAMNPLPVATGLLMNLKHMMFSRKKNKVS